MTNAPAKPPSRHTLARPTACIPAAERREQTPPAGPDDHRHQRRQQPVPALPVGHLLQLVVSRTAGVRDEVDRLRTGGGYGLECCGDHRRRSNTEQKRTDITRGHSDAPSREISHPTICATFDGERDKNPKTAVTIGVLDGADSGHAPADGAALGPGRDPIDVRRRRVTVRPVRGRRSTPDRGARPGCHARQDPPVPPGALGRALAAIAASSRGCTRRDIIDALDHLRRAAAGRNRLPGMSHRPASAQRRPPSRRVTAGQRTLPLAGTTT
jgi:hypothetical protein